MMATAGKKVKQSKPASGKSAVGSTKSSASAASPGPRATSGTSSNGAVVTTDNQPFETRSV